jgi:hypothetical protein
MQSPSPERFSPGPVPVGAKIVVIFQACVEQGVSLALRHTFEFAFVILPEQMYFMVLLIRIGGTGCRALRRFVHLVLATHVLGPERPSCCFITSAGFLFQSREERSADDGGPLPCKRLVRAGGGIPAAASGQQTHHFRLRLKVGQQPSQSNRLAG